MIIRKQIEIERFIESINKKWSLSIIEKDILEDVLYLFLKGKNDEIKKTQHLLNDEIEELLKLLNNRTVIDYVTDNGDFIASDDEDGLVDALDDLKFKWIEKVDLSDYDDEDLLDECDSRDLKWNDYNNTDIVTKNDLEEMIELFLNLDFNKRQQIISNLK